MKITQNTIAIMLSISFVLGVMACKTNKKHLKMTDKNTNQFFPKGEKLPNDYFTGNAFLNILVPKDKNNEFLLSSVTFEPGARTIWHTHPKGQVLIVTEGEGFYQEKGQSARALQKGDVVNIPENIEHWHGASANSTFVHIAITNYKGNENVVWLKPLTDEEYNSARKN
jgi:quercetin dioxygenase-like cupin family protein